MSSFEESSSFCHGINLKWYESLGELCLARVVRARWPESWLLRGLKGTWALPVVCVKIGEVVLFRLSAMLVCWAEERGDYWEVFCLFAVLHVHKRWYFRAWSCLLPTDVFVVNGLSLRVPGALLDPRGMWRGIEECVECCVTESLCKLTAVLETANWNCEENVVVEERS